MHRKDLVWTIFLLGFFKRELIRHEIYLISLQGLFLDNLNYKRFYFCCSKYSEFKQELH